MAHSHGHECSCNECSTNYQLLEDGTFVIENYNQAQPFSSFFPGIAGLKGIPMWAFYVNRNQGIASFGIKNKSYSLMEFYAANDSYALTGTQGFRTFVKIKKGNDIIYYEAFRDNTGFEDEIRQDMLIRSHEVIFEEVNRPLGLKTIVRYFTLPQEPIAALVRVVEFENIGKEEFSMEVVDGMPKIIPYWMDAGVLKFMSHTAMAWAEVTNFARTGIPFYKLKVEISDRPEVTVLKKGNFYFGLVPSKGKLAPAQVIIDPELVFGQDTGMEYPNCFMDEPEYKLPKSQFGDNKYPCAFSFFKVKLAPGAKETLYSMAGHIESEEKLNAFVKKASSVKYFEKKAQENAAIIDDVTTPIKTESGIKEFDLYCRQTYLDNLLRGGMPIMLPAGNKEMVFYVYSRKHGDLERDYNDFQLSPTFYSQGNGNYRDTNQNKRSDIFFNPQIGDFNVQAFYNLIQLDGYNPLLVKGSTFFFDTEKKEAKNILKKTVDAKDLKTVTALFSKPFEPGGILLSIAQQDIALKVDDQEFLRQVLGGSEWINEAEHGEGFWTDHWTYNLDLLESFLAVYPEKEREILIDKKDFTYYDNAHRVVPRAEKYVNADGKIRQFDAVVLDPGKAKLLRERTRNVRVVRDNNGKGKIYRSTLLGKLVCMALNKLATLDSEGIGIEMEAGKPSWYDALNGLPGVFGSSVPETFELKRMMRFMREHLSKLGVAEDYAIALPEEMFSFFKGLEKLLQQPALSPFAFWDKATALKEDYRSRTLMGISGKEETLTWGQLDSFLAKAIKKIDKGLARAVDGKTGLYYTYFAYDAVASKPNKKVSFKGWPCVTVSKFKRHPLPLFLEAEVHYLKTEENIDKVKAHFAALKRSPLFDAKLNMYKVNASLESESKDLGRCTVFAPGWLENESIWLHMEYKYLLELLKSGLGKEFFAEFKKAGICFQDPARYGRSILENSSFISSSAFPDPKNWGRGFVARLSGSTAEFIEMWLLMTVGARPFTLNARGELALEFKPAIPGAFFTEQNIFSFVFLGKTLVKYHNFKRLDTFSGAAKIAKTNIIWNDGDSETVHGAVIGGKSALRIRNREARAIDVFIE